MAVKCQLVTMCMFGGKVVTARIVVNNNRSPYWEICSWGYKWSLAIL